MSNSEDEFDDLLEEEKSREEKRVDRTRQEQDGLGDYQIPEDVELDDSYDLVDAQKDAKIAHKEINELKNEIREQSNGQTSKNLSEMDDIEKLVSQMVHYAEAKKEGYENGKKSRHQFHETYSAMAGIFLSMMGFLYSGMFHTLGILGFLYIMYDSTSFLPGEKESKFARLVSHHPKFYIAGFVATYIVFIGSGQSPPAIEGVLTTIITTVIGA